jgi:aminopeptidase
MPTDPRIERWAKILVDYSINIQQGEWVYLLTNSIESQPLYEAVRERVIKKGAYPSDHFCYDPFSCSAVGRDDYQFLKHASKKQLKNLPTFKLNEIKKMQAFVLIEAPLNTKELAGISLQKITCLAQTLRPLCEEKLKKKWVYTYYPTRGAAQQAEMALAEFEEFVFNALFVNQKEPILAWRRLAYMQKELVDVLNNAEEIQIRGRETDLKFIIKGRKTISGDGIWNMPDGEVFTAPVEDSVNGKIFFDLPANYLGKTVEGIRLQFRDGKVVKASAEKGSEILAALLEVDEGARYVGEFGIGTNFCIKHHVKEILFDEKIGGTIHLALGDGYEECGSANNSAVHCDLVKDLRTEGNIFVDGQKLKLKGLFNLKQSGIRRFYFLAVIL